MATSSPIGSKLSICASPPINDSHLAITENKYILSLMSKKWSLLHNLQADMQCCLCGNKESKRIRSAKQEKNKIQRVFCSIKQLSEKVSMGEVLVREQNEKLRKEMEDMREEFRLRQEQNRASSPRKAPPFPFEPNPKDFQKASTFATPRAVRASQESPGLAHSYVRSQAEVPRQQPRIIEHKVQNGADIEELKKVIKKQQEAAERERQNTRREIEELRRNLLSRSTPTQVPLVVHTPQHSLPPLITPRDTEVLTTPQPALHIAPGNDNTLPTDTKFVNIPRGQRIQFTEFKKKRKDEDSLEGGTDDSIQRIIDRNNRHLNKLDVIVSQKHLLSSMGGGSQPSLASGRGGAHQSVEELGKVLDGLLEENSEPKK